MTDTNNTLVIEEYSKDNQERNSTFGTVEITQDLPINPNGSYHLVLEKGQLHLKEKVLLLQPQGENSTGIAASTQPEGGCGHYHTQPVNVYDVTNNSVEPEPSYTSSTELLTMLTSSLVDISASESSMFISLPSATAGTPTEGEDLTPVYIGVGVAVAGVVTIASVTATGILLYRTSVKPRTFSAGM